MDYHAKCCYILAPCFLLIFVTCSSGAEEVASSVGGIQLNAESDSLEWPMMGESLHDDEGYLDYEVDELYVEGTSSSSSSRRRSLLLWNKARYYISYAALSANRIPCPPRSGRSYYTHNCYFASGPAHPYTRGCSAITRCRR